MGSGRVDGVKSRVVVPLAGGFVFPVMMAILQDDAGQARGTVSSLSNVAIHAGTTVGVAVV